MKIQLLVGILIKVTKKHFMNSTKKDQSNVIGNQDVKGPWLMI